MAGYVQVFLRESENLASSVCLSLVALTSTKYPVSIDKALPSAVASRCAKDSPGWLHLLRLEK